MWGMRPVMRVTKNGDGSGPCSPSLPLAQRGSRRDRHRRRFYARSGAGLHDGALQETLPLALGHACGLDGMAISWGLLGLLLSCTFSVTAHAVSLPREACPPAARGLPLRCAFAAGAGLEHAALRATKRAALRKDRCICMAAGRAGTDRAALELAVAEQVERRYMVKKSIQQLQAKRDEEVEKEQWARILSRVNADVGSDLEEEPGPWELTPDLLEEVDDVFGDEVASPYLRLALGANETGGGVDVLGRLDEIDDGIVQSAFDTAIREQDEKRPKGLLEQLGLGLGLDFGRWSAGSDEILWGGRQKPAEKAIASKTFEESKDEIEAQIEEDYAFLVLRSARLADSAYSQGRARFPVKGHKVPWELIVREVHLPLTPIPLSRALYAPQSTSKPSSPHTLKGGFYVSP
jgi:hypothetical protein